MFVSRRHLEPFSRFMARWTLRLVVHARGDRYIIAAWGSRAARWLVAKGPMETPCIDVCQIDPASGLCLGCWRTREEIAAWTSMTSPERRRIMGELAGRKARSEREGR